MHRQHRQTSRLREDDRSKGCHASSRWYGAVQIGRNAAESTVSPPCSVFPCTDHDQTRWGVGFGPRDCSDYQTGVSIIPIERLTDADRKWMLTAEYGGSGGKQIEPGMVVEEPDIEIGAGVSSKGTSYYIAISSTDSLTHPKTAISRRMATDQGGMRGPKSTRTGPSNGERGGRDRFRQSDRHDSSGGSGNEREPTSTTNNTIGVPPAVPTFGFNFANMTNPMGMFPPGFMMGGAAGSTQPPPPGQN